MNVGSKRGDCYDGNRGLESAGADFWGVVIPRRQTASRSLSPKYAGVGFKNPSQRVVPGRTSKGRNMIIQKIDRDWRVYELSREELEMILNDASCDDEQRVEQDHYSENGGSHV
jgi:hypothetical protein